VLLAFLIKSTQQTSRKFPRFAKYLNSKIPKANGLAQEPKTPHLLKPDGLLRGELVLRGGSAEQSSANFPGRNPSKRAQEAQQILAFATG
jgi:hypothetical protein